MAATAPAQNSAIPILSRLFRSKDMAMAVGVVMIVALLVIPLPAAAVDMLIALNMALSIGILLLTMYISQPMEFSVFPTVLLLVTLFRLGINMAASRLILLDGNAGGVVTTFGNLIVGGNYVVGVVIFMMLMIIQFLVINNGTGRVAEVSARFTLDAMPGKQLSIDADLNAGLIDEVQARARRNAIAAEADFYGSMDGASKFVRGDAIAAIIIIAVNIIGGIVIGMLQRHLAILDALQSYTLMTIGAGLAIQIPALLVSAASGLIVTRSTSIGSLGTDLFGQLSNFNTLAIAAMIVGLMLFIPGLPKLPFGLIAVGLGIAAYFVQKMQASEAVTETLPQSMATTEPETPEDMLGMVVIDPMELEIGYTLIPLIDEQASDNLLRRITGIRRQMLTELGLILPVVRIRDNLRLGPQAYRIKVRGQEVSQGELWLDQLLAIPGSESEGQVKGIPTTEPAFGLPAFWIAETERNRAELSGYTVVNPLSVLSTHLAEIGRNFAPELLNRQMVQEMLNQLKTKSPAAVDGIIPDMLSLGELQAVMRSLLHERLPIRDLDGILETIANHAASTRDPNILAEAVRQTMANTISSMYRDEKQVLQVFTLSPQIESTLRSALISGENGFGFQIDAMLAHQILTKTGEQMEKLAQEGCLPVLICPREIRLAFRRLIEKQLPNLIVLAYSEVSNGTKVRSHGMVEVS
jgi:flagellar biosynthesis protein FlhA